jgi:sugar lactone lactonase YvrE
VGPDGRVYVVEACHRRVEQYAPSGELLGAWDTGGTAGTRGDAQAAGAADTGGDSGFGLPWGIAVDPTRGLVYVADWGRDRVQRFDLDGHHLGPLGRSGAAPGALWRPAGLAVDPSGRLAVADWGNDRVQVWTPDGRPEAVLEGGGGGGHSRSGAEPTGSPASSGGLRGPRGVAFDGAGTLYVADTLGHRVLVYRRR